MSSGKRYKIPRFIAQPFDSLFFSFFVDLDIDSYFCDCPYCLHEAPFHRLYFGPHHHDH